MEVNRENAGARARSPGTVASRLSSPGVGPHENSKAIYVYFLLWAGGHWRQVKRLPQLQRVPELTMSNGLGAIRRGVEMEAN